MAYEVAVEDEATVGDRNQVILGRWTVENRFVFREPIDRPQAFACIYVPGKDEYDMRPHPVEYRVGDDRVPDNIAGAGTITATMTVRLTDEEVEATDGPISIERADECPEPGDTPRIVVVTGDEMPQPPRA